jgi:hypothetical protein
MSSLFIIWHVLLNDGTKFLTAVSTKWKFLSENSVTRDLISAHALASSRASLIQKTLPQKYDVMAVALNGDCIHRVINASLPQQRWVLLLWNKYHLFMLSPRLRNGHKTRARGGAKLFMHTPSFLPPLSHAAAPRITFRTYTQQQRYCICGRNYQITAGL